MTTTPTLDVNRRPSPDQDMVFVKWLGSMLDGSTSTGTLTIKADRTQPLLDDDLTQPRTILTNAIVAPVQEITMVEDIGTRKYMYAVVPVPATDDPDIIGHGFTYTADIKLKNGATYGPYTFTAPLATPDGELWLNKVAAATPTPGEALPQITMAAFDALAARVSAVELGGGGTGGGPHAATHGAGGADPVSLSASQTVSGVFAAARLGTGTATADRFLAGDGTWKAAATLGAHAATHAAGGTDPLALGAAQITSGVLATARLGTGAASSGKYLDGTGSWVTLPAGGGGAATVPAGTPIVRFANADTTWPADLPTPTAEAPLLLYADISANPGALVYPAPPSHTRNAFMRYEGPEWAESSPTVTASATATGRAVTFTATPALVAGTTANYTWTFSGGGSATGLTPTYVFPTVGAKSGTVTLTDSNNITATATANITVTEGAPSVTIVPTIDGLTISWAAVATDPEGDTITYSWSGTDSLTGTAATVAKTYATGGTKSATVVVSDGHGQTATATTTASLTQSDAAGIFTADTFTTAAGDLAATLLRNTEPGALGGYVTKPVSGTGLVSVGTGTMSLRSNAALLYATGTAKPRVKFTIVVATGTAILDQILSSDGEGNYLSVRFKTSGKGAWVARGTAPSVEFPSGSWTDWQVAPNDSWAEGDVVESSYDAATTTVTIKVTRAGSQVAGSPWTFVKDAPAASATFSGVGSGSYTTAAKIDDLVIGRVL